MKLKFLWNVSAIIHLILGLLMWFLFFTDYSLVGYIPDIVFPPLVGIIAFICLLRIKTSDKFQQIWVTLAHLPAIIGGAFYLLTGLIMLVPPFLLIPVFMISDAQHETQVQQIVSPDGTQSAYVYFRGPVSGGMGRIHVRTRYSILPFIERDLVSLDLRKVHTDSTVYVEWHSNHTIYILQTGQEISTGEIKAEIPEAIDFLYSMIRTIP
jgi:hypothetical protein